MATLNHTMTDRRPTRSHSSRRGRVRLRRLPKRTTDYSWFVERPLTEIAGCRAAHSRLASGLAGITDSATAGPSLVPNWTVGLILAHLANNAEAMIRRIEAAQRGELIEQYPGGAEGRAEHIERRANQPTAALVSDVVATADQLDSLFATLTDSDWDLPVRTVAGGTHALSLLPFRRWREVEVHHSDLDIGFTVSEWSPELIDRALPRLLAGAERRADRTLLAAWLLGRGEAPPLDAWG